MKLQTEKLDSSGNSPDRHMDISKIESSSAFGLRFFQIKGRTEVRDIGMAMEVQSPLSVTKLSELKVSLKSKSLERVTGKKNGRGGREREEGGRGEGRERGGRKEKERSKLGNRK